MLQIKYQGQIYQMEPCDNVILKNEGTYGNGSIDWAPRGLFLHQIAAQLGINQPVAAEIDNKIMPLDMYITKDCEVNFITLNDTEGLMILRRTGIFLLNYAAMQIFPSDYQQVESDTLDSYTISSDFALPPDACITDNDLTAMQHLINKILQEGTKITAKKLPYFQTIKEVKTKTVHIYCSALRKRMMDVDRYRYIYIARLF